MRGGVSGRRVVVVGLGERKESVRQTSAISTAIRTCKVFRQQHSSKPDSREEAAASGTSMYSSDYIPAPSNRSPPDTFKSTKVTRGDLLEGAGRDLSFMISMAVLKFGRKNEGFHGSSTLVLFDDGLPVSVGWLFSEGFSCSFFSTLTEYVSSELKPSATSQPVFLQFHLPGQTLGGN